MHPTGDDTWLRAALRTVAEQDGELGASLEVHARLLAEVRSIRLARRRRRQYAAMWAVAAGLVLAVSVPAWQLANRHWSTSARGPALDVKTRAASSEVVTAFLPLTYSLVPVSGAQIVRMDVPRTALASVGLEPIEVVDGTASDSVLADVLVGEDGLARSIRFVRRVAN